MYTEKNEPRAADAVDSTESDDATAAPGRAPQWKPRRYQPEYSFIVPRTWPKRFALGCLAAILLFGILREQLPLALVSSLPLFLGIWCLHRTNGETFVEGFRVFGILLTVLGLGIVLHVLTGFIHFSVIGLCASIFLTWLLEC